MCTSVQKLSECRVLLYDSPETAEGYGSVGIRLQALAENFFKPMDLCCFGWHTMFTEFKAVYAVLIVRGNRAIVAYHDGKKWQAGLLMYNRTLSAVLFKRRCINLGLAPRPDQVVPPQMSPEVANKFVLSCPFLRVGDFVASACWGKALITSVSKGLVKYEQHLWEDFVSYPFAAP